MEIKKIIYLADLMPELGPEKSEPQDIKVVIMAGGLGKRLHPMTKDVPKPMIKVGDNSMIEIVIDNFKKFGFIEFLVSVNFLSDQITSHLEDGKKMGVKIAGPSIQGPEGGGLNNGSGSYSIFFQDPNGICFEIYAGSMNVSEFKESKTIA